mmetsp:Transcript_18692/g.58708  ORF Transcript_18692/g.58708 Transcript_18692/m.58708 type:complete len:230 (+) Transcript_18692:814-1503(+)
MAFRSFVPTRTVTWEGRQAITSSKRLSTFLAHCMFTPALMTAVFPSSPGGLSRSRSAATQSAERLPRVRLSPRHTTGADEGLAPALGVPLEAPSRKARGVSSSSATATRMMVREAKTMDHPMTLTTGSLMNSSAVSQTLRATGETERAGPAPDQAAPAAPVALLRGSLAPRPLPTNAAPRSQSAASAAARSSTAAPRRLRLLCSPDVLGCAARPSHRAPAMLRDGGKIL